MVKLQRTPNYQNARVMDLTLMIGFLFPSKKKTREGRDPHHPRSSPLKALYLSHCIFPMLLQSHFTLKTAHHLTSHN